MCRPSWGGNHIANPAHRHIRALPEVDNRLGSENRTSNMSHSFQGKPVRTSIGGDALASAVGVTLGLHDAEQVFELPARVFEQLPFAIYICDRDGLVLRYNGRAAELWGRSPKLGDPNERFCGSYRMVRP